MDAKIESKALPEASREAIDNVLRTRLSKIQFRKESELIRATSVIRVPSLVALCLERLSQAPLSHDDIQIISHCPVEVLQQFITLLHAKNLLSSELVTTLAPLFPFIEHLSFSSQLRTLATPVDDILMQTIAPFLVNLRSLTLKNSFRLTSLQSIIPYATQLTSLNLDRCKSFEALPQFFAHFPKLVSLILTGTRVRAFSLQGVEKLSELEQLDISHTWCGLDNPAPDTQQAFEAVTGECKRLTDLNIAGCLFKEDAVRSISQLSLLKSLDVSFLHKLNQSFPINFSNLQCLTSLDVSRNPTVDDSTIQQISLIPSLTSLNISRTSITDACGLALRRLINLVYLDLGFLNISDRGALDFSPHLVHLQTLNLSYSLITDQWVTMGLVHLRELRFLHIQAAKLTDSALPILAAHPNLVELDIGGTGFNGRCLNSLLDFPKIQRIGLWQTEICPSLISSLIGRTVFEFDGKMKASSGTYMLVVGRRAPNGGLELPIKSQGSNGASGARGDFKNKSSGDDDEKGT